MEKAFGKHWFLTAALFPALSITVFLIPVFSNDSWSKEDASFNKTGPEPKPKYGTADNPEAHLLTNDHEYFQSSQHPAPDFWSLNSYYFGQFNDQSCSAASLSMVLNASRQNFPKADSERLILPQDLVNQIKIENWKERLTPKGFKNKGGTPLDVFAKITEAAFKKYGFPQVKVEVVHVKDLSPQTLSKIREDLIKNEATADDYMISNFSMKSFVNTSDYGHIAPVGAYDAAHRKVLIFDPYRYEYEPYWVSETAFAQGMNTIDSESSTHRGYLFIHLK